jgi:pimeloyl-ACP methyl ester carboxylesterase
VASRLVRANGIAINVEERGPAGGTPLLLVNGHSGVIPSWPEELIGGFVARGFRTVCYDNRDVGKSEKFSGRPDLPAIAAAVREGGTPDMPYMLADMAADGIGVLDALGIERVHAMGISMGGMIVQRMAIHHPERLISATSIMSSTGNPDLPRASREVMQAVGAVPSSDDREAVIRQRIAGTRVIESPAWPRTEAALHAHMGVEYDYMYFPEGGARQYAAIVGDGSRVEALKQVRMPFLVIHGRADPLALPEGGIDTAKSVPGATLELIDGMGHDLPVELCSRYVDLIATHARAAEQRAAAE